MQIGINFFPTDTAIQPIELGEQLEARGFESLWLAEHSHIPTSRATPRPGGGELPEHYWRTLDAFVSLAAVAARTERLRLGTGIALVAQRDPIWLAKQVASLDVVSNGRVSLGIGYGWNKEEMAQHGVVYQQRRRLVAEKVGMMKALWTQDEASFQGDLVTLEPSWAWPKPVQKPHPPIIMGSAPGPKTFAAIAEYCDGWMPIVGRGNIEESLDALSATLDAAGRSLGDLELSVYGATPDRDAWSHLESLGFTRVLLHLPSVPSSEARRLLDEYQTLIDG